MLHRFEVDREARIFTSVGTSENVVTIDLILELQLDLSMVEKGDRRTCKTQVSRFSEDVKLWVRWCAPLRTRQQKQRFEKFKDNARGLPSEVKILIPGESEKKWTLLMMAHAGLAAHCGVHVMKKNLQQY